jgi:hypothetical protein
MCSAPELLRAAADSVHPFITDYIYLFDLFLVKKYHERAGAVF